MRLSIPLLLSATLLSSGAFAQELKLDSLKDSQGKFRALTEDLGAALSYRGITPTEPLGILGFDVGLALTTTELANANVYGSGALKANPALFSQRYVRTKAYLLALMSVRPSPAFLAAISNIWVANFAMPFSTAVF